MTVGACNCILTEFNVLDLTTWDEGVVIYSMDTHHEPFSTTSLSSNEDTDSKLAFGFLGMTEGTCIDMSGNEGFEALAQQLNTWVQLNGRRRSAAYPYGLESLRKRGYGEET